MKQYSLIFLILFATHCIAQNKTGLNKPAGLTSQNSNLNCIKFNNNSHTLPLQDVTSFSAPKQVTDTFWLFNECDDTLIIANIESTTLSFFEVDKTLLPRQNTPLIFNGKIEHNSYDFTTNHFSCLLTLGDNSKLFFGLVIPTISHNMVATYNKDGTLNYAISKRKDARFNNVAFTYKNGHVRAKGLVKDGDTTVKVGTWGYFKDGPGTIDGVEYSKSVSLSAFGKAPGSQHTNFLIKVLENGKWKQPVAEIYNYEKRFFITKKTKRIVAYTDSTSFTFKIKYKRIFPEISKKFFLLHPNEKTIKIRGYEVPFHLQHDTYGIVLDESKIGGKSTNFDLLIERYQKKYPKIIKVGIVNNRNAINIKELSHTEQKQLLKEIENDSLILFACNVFSLPFSEDNTTYDNQIYLDVDENRLNKCRRAIKKLGFDFAKSENGEVDYWYIVYRSKIVDEAFFEAYKTIGNFRYVSSASLNINKLDTRQFDFKEF